MIQKNANEIYQFHVSLKGSDPLIWRRFQVEGTIDFHQFHQVLQRVMGWEDCHLYGFSIGKRRITTMDQDYDLEFAEPNWEDSRQLSVGTIFRNIGKRIGYTYDFGDNWHHEIRFEKRSPWNGTDEYPLCLDGKMACPPEDSGGWGRFNIMVNVLNNQTAGISPGDVKDIRDWIGDFDPERFDIEKINRDLKNGTLETSDPWDEIEDFLCNKEERGESFLMAELIDASRIDPHEIPQQEIIDLILDEPVFIQEGDHFHPKTSFLHNFSIRIMPFDEEIKLGMLILGYRILPFQPPGQTVDDIELIWGKKQLPGISISIDPQPRSTLFFLLDEEDLPFFDEGDSSHPSVVTGFDIKKLLIKCSFHPGDSLILTPIDLYNGKFDVKYEPMAETLKNRKAIEKTDQLILSTLQKTYQGKKNTRSIQHQFLHTYFQLQDKQPWIPGSPLNQLIIPLLDRIKYNPDKRKIIHFR